MSAKGRGREDDGPAMSVGGSRRLKAAELHVDGTRARIAGAGAGAKL